MRQTERGRVGSQDLALLNEGEQKPETRDSLSTEIIDELLTTWDLSIDENTESGVSRKYLLSLFLLVMNE